MSLEQAIERLAAAIERSNSRSDIQVTGTADADPAPAAVKKAVAKAAPKAAEKAAAPEVKAAVLADVQKDAVALVAKHGRDKLNAILAEYGVPKCSALTQEDLNKAAVQIKDALAKEAVEV